MCGGLRVWRCWCISGSHSIANHVANRIAHTHTVCIAFCSSHSIAHQSCGRTLVCCCFLYGVCCSSKCMLL